MIVDLNGEMEEHLARVTALAIEASNADPEEHGYQSRASAMTACSTMLVQLTKAQEALITMEGLHKVEQTIIDTVKEYLDEEQLGHVLDKLNERLSAIS